MSAFCLRSTVQRSEDAREDLEAEYRIYHALGKNGVMDGRRAKFLNLPYEPVEDA